jgi:hypothetical protein
MGRKHQFQSHIRYGLHPLNLHCNPRIYFLLYMDLYFEVDVFFMFVVDHFDKGVKVLFWMVLMLNGQLPLGGL